MIEKIYEKHLEEIMPDLEELIFPALLREVRKLMGLFQYKASCYTGIEYSRFKKMELGMFTIPIESWELQRISAFFKIPLKLLKLKEKEFLKGKRIDKTRLHQKVWKRK